MLWHIFKSKVMKVCSMALASIFLKFLLPSSSVGGPEGRLSIHKQYSKRRLKLTGNKQEPGQLGHILQVDEMVIADEACEVCPRES